MLNQRIIILEEKCYIHPAFSNYVASKDGKIINVKTRKNLKNIYLIEATIILEFTVKT